MNIVFDTQVDTRVAIVGVILRCLFCGFIFVCSFGLLLFAAS